MLNQLTAAAQIVGVLVAMIGLFYVGCQIRENTAA